MRPSVHFTVRRGWINDPYGVSHHGGRYHLFFQHLPDGTDWAPAQQWGHAVSDDLVHWTEEPVVLAPGDGDGGIWSGTVVADGGGAMFYTSVQVEDPQVGRVRVARPSDDSWRGWVKGPVVVEPPADLDLVAFRDPFVLRDDASHCWRMLVGGGLADGTGLVMTWTSADLETWAYDGVLASRASAEREPVWTGDVWECPQLLRVDDAWVLLASVWSDDKTLHEACAVGDLVGGRFEARSWQRLTYGAHYAGSAFTDAEGRPCLVHWLRGVADPDGAWAGAHSVPHVLRLDGDRVVAEPHPAVAGHVERIGDVHVVADGPVVEVFTPDGVGGYVCSR